MMWVLAVIVVLLIGAVAVVAAGSGDPLVPVYDDRPDVVVPADGPLGAEDLLRVRFTTAFRGYRASEVDALLDRLAAQLGNADRPPAPDAAGPETATDD